ncbi:MAG TPA: hypothetical protein DEA78_22850 [Cyanobacteria bacterium UBA11159]|nr:hypothetical protein [Cyanobacteria bacterium UBA11366]HBR76444.1 hypothetical protein [Cyanobacteria bacterium UBA11159]
MAGQDLNLRLMEPDNPKYFGLFRQVVDSGILVFTSPLLYQTELPTTGKSKFEVVNIELLA